MISDLLSLSLTDRPLNNDQSLRTSELINMIVQQGGNFEYNNSTNLIIGIALLVIATVIFIGENNWASVNARVEHLNCNMSNCILIVEYHVNNTTYKKDYIVPSDYKRPSDNHVMISYDLSNPSISYLGTSNYNNYVYILAGVGVIFLGIWCVFLDKNASYSSFIPALNFSSKTESQNAIYSETN